MICSGESSICGHFFRSDKTGTKKYQDRSIQTYCKEVRVPRTVFAPVLVLSQFVIKYVTKWVDRILNSVSFLDATMAKSV